MVTFIDGLKVVFKIFDKAFWKFMRGFLWFLIFLIFLILLSSAIGFYFWEHNYKDEVTQIVDNMSVKDFKLNEKQTIYYSDGSVMLTYAPDTDEVVESTEDITEVLRTITLAAEDERFYDHHGVDYKSIIRAFITNFKSKDTVQGASTITQQLVKLSYLSSEKSYDRKIKEILISLEVERRFSKDEILLLYLNRGYFGNGMYGIADASQFYFSKSYKELNYNEAATLIGILNSPSNLEPICHFDANQNRKERILNIADKPITDVALNIQIDYGKAYSYSSEGIGCVSYIEDLIKSNEITDTDVKTTIDRDLQITVENKINSLKDPLQAAAVVIDNESGKVITIVGGKSTGDIFSLNRAYQSARQTGSSIKPLLDYGVIFDTYAIDTSFEVVDKGGKGMPKNSSGGHIGRCTIKKAATKSINTVAFRLYSYLLDDGVEPLEYLEQMNFAHITDTDYKAKAVSIGGFTYGATVLEMASGYAALANAGLYRKPTALSSVIVEPEPVYSPIAAYWTTDLLSDVAKTGTARRLKVNVPISCKTGTTNDNKDAWLCGYTRDYTIAIWCGADNNNEKYSVKSSGEVLDIFQTILDSVDLVNEPIYSEDEANFILNSEDYRRDPEGLEEYFNTLSPKRAYVPTPVVPEVPIPQVPQEIPVPTPEVVTPPVPEVPQEPTVQVFDEAGNLIQ